MTHENSGDLKITDETIMAFIDGELDQFSRLEFESALQKDSDLRYKVDQLRQNDAMLFNSLKVATDTPLPSVTMPTAKPKRLPSIPGSKLDIIPSWSDFRSFFTAPVACYTAAVLCLGVLIGNTFSIFDRNYISSQTEFEQTLVISAAINMALEKELSGTGYGWSNLQAKSNGEVTPLKTWKNQCC